MEDLTIQSVSTLTLKRVREMFEKDNITRKNNKSANMPIIKLIDLLDDDNKKITCEIAKGGSILNRGSVIECLVKLYFNDKKSASKYGAGRVDMIKNGVKYEIKYSSSKGYATYNPKQNYDNLIFVNQTGIYLANKNNIVLDNCGKHIKTITMKGVKTLLEF